jgi:hypothetical protein
VLATVDAPAVDAAAVDASADELDEGALDAAVRADAVSAAAAVDAVDAAVGTAAVGDAGSAVFAVDAVDAAVVDAVALVDAELVDAELDAPAFRAGAAIVVAGVAAFDAGVRLRIGAVVASWRSGVRSVTSSAIGAGTLPEPSTDVATGPVGPSAWSRSRAGSRSAI